MKYVRIIVEKEVDESILKKLGMQKNASFSFSDFIYINKDGSSITDDTLKIRVYEKNEWDSKAVIVIRKKAVLEKGAKEDVFLLREEFDTLEEAQAYVFSHLSKEYDFAFQLQKSGVEYVHNDFHMWVEHIKDMGISIEFGSEDVRQIENALQLFPKAKRLTESVPEYLFHKLKEENKKDEV